MTRYFSPTYPASRQVPFINRPQTWRLIPHRLDLSVLQHKILVRQTLFCSVSAIICCSFMLAGSVPQRIHRVFPQEFAFLVLAVVHSPTVRTKFHNDCIFAAVSALVRHQVVGMSHCCTGWQQQIAGGRLSSADRGEPRTAPRRADGR